MFSRLCGDSAYPRIALGITKWPSSGIESPAMPQEPITATTYGLNKGEAERRLGMLEEKYWKDLIGLGSKTYRIATKECALQVVRSILEKLELTTKGGNLELQIQTEVVVERKTIPQTEAGKVLEPEGRKNRTKMTKEDRDAEKAIKEELKKMDRQLKELATDKNTSSGFKWLTKVFGAVL